MAPNVEFQFQSNAAKAEIEKRARRILAELAKQTAEGAAADAPRRSGFLASTVGHIPPDGRPVAARAETVGSQQKLAADVPAPGQDHAIAYAAAAYALAVELKQPFLLTSAVQALQALGGIVAREGI